MPGPGVTFQYPGPGIQASVRLAGMAAARCVNQSAARNPGAPSHGPQATWAALWPASPAPPWVVVLATGESEARAVWITVRASL